MNFRRHTDRILMASMKRFGEEVKFYPKSGGVFCVRAIFDNEYRSLDLNTEQLLSVTQPALGVNLNDLKFEVMKGDEINIRSQLFVVQEKRPDGQGGMILLLHRKNSNERIRETKVR